MYISEVLDRICQVGSALFFATMLILVLFQVAARYIFQAAPAWTAELSRYCMVWGGLLGATVAFKAEAEPRIVEPPPNHHRVRAGFALWIRAMAVTIFLGPVLYYSPGFLARTLHRTTEALGISTLWVSMAVPLAIAVMFWHLLAKILAFGMDRQTEN
jgi:TRAP-type C4-dicarboxylate transport system permease small subunit